MTAYAMLFCGFIGFLVAASGMNAETGTMVGNFVAGIVSAVLMLIGLIKLKLEERQNE